MTEVESFIATLLGYVVAYRRRADPSLLANHLPTTMMAGKEIFKKLGSTRAAQMKAINLIAKGKTNNNGMPSPAYAQALAEIREEFRCDKEQRAILKEFLTSEEVSQEQQQLISMLMRMLTPDSETVDANEKALDAKISLVPDRVLRLAMVPQAEARVNNQPEHLAEIKHLVKKWTGRNEHTMSAEEKADVKEKDPERYKHFLKLNTMLNDAWKLAVRSMVREEGHLVSVNEVIKQLRDEGITHHPFQQMMNSRLGNLKLDEDCKVYTPQGVLLQGGIPPVGATELKPNPKYDPKTEATYYYSFFAPNAISAHPSKCYTVRSREGTKNEGSQMILDAMPVVEGKRPRWIKDLSSGDPMKRTYAAMCEIIWDKVPRIGSPGNKKNNKPTYGLSTLQISHVNINNGVLIFSYSGKDGIKQRHVMKPDLPEHKQTIAIVQKLMRGKERTDDLWTDPNGKRVTGTKFNAYLKSIGIPVTAHEFRDIRGTKMMSDLLENAKVPKGAKLADVEKIVKTLAVKVGVLLGHKSQGKDTAATAIKAYIIPAVIANFFRDRQMRVPKWVPKGGRDAA